MTSSSKNIKNISTSHQFIKTPSSKSNNRSQFETPTANHRVVRASLERVSPFLTPKSTKGFERFSTSAQTTRSFAQNGGDIKTKIQNDKTLHRTASSYLTKPVTPSKPVRSELLRRTYSAEKTKLSSPFGKQIYGENKGVSEHMRQVGAEVFKVKLQSKDIQQQVKTLENRIEKLKIEEQNATERLQKTQRECQKIVHSKRRHQTELIDSQSRKQNQIDYLKNQRKKQMEAKMHQNENILKSLVTNMEMKNKQYKEVKQSLVEANEHFNKETVEKNKVRDQVIQEIQELRRRIAQGKKNREDSAKEYSLVIHRQEKLETERSKQDALNRRLEELTKNEGALIDKIRATNTLQESAYHNMRKIYLMKVSAEKPLEFDFF